MNLDFSFNQFYQENGYAIIPDVIGSDLVEEIQNHVMWLQNKYPDIRPEAFHHDLLINDPFIHHLLDNKIMLDIIEVVIGS
ncbi:MAG: phytanoyl-CoA dioxygenase family protein, partial [Candidatus Marinimicrobia bacterium]|nr:phytanoyl-CoA dioxygenase family protein [Candidatus Neomarinimicrobiota bacterium]